MREQAREMKEYTRNDLLGLAFARRPGEPLDEDELITMADGLNSLYITHDASDEEKKAMEAKKQEFDRMFHTPRHPREAPFHEWSHTHICVCTSFSCSHLCTGLPQRSTKLLTRREPLKRSGRFMYSQVSASLV